MREVYPDYIPVVRIARPADKSVQVPKQCLVMHVKSDQGKLVIKIEGTDIEVETDVEQVRTSHFEADKFYS